MQVLAIEQDKEELLRKVYERIQILKILAGEYKFESPYWKGVAVVSDSGMCMCTCMCMCEVHNVHLSSRLHAKLML